MPICNKTICFDNSNKSLNKIFEAKNSDVSICDSEKYKKMRYI